MNEPTADPAPDPTGSATPEPVAEPAAAPAPDAAGVAPDGAGVAPDARADSVRRQNRLAALGLGVVGIALAFGAGIAVGRATAPGGAAPSLPPVAVSPGASGGSSPTVGPAPTGTAALPSDGPWLGRPDAAVVVDYWADYQCPYCSTFASEVIPRLLSRIETGKIALVHRDFAFLGEESLDAAIAVRCAAREGRYWQMHDAVYASQVGENQGAFARPRLAQIAAAVGLDATAFAACMDEREPLVEVLDDTSAGLRVGIVSTPSIDVNGTRFLGVPDIDELLAAIDAAAAGASPAPLPTPAPINDPWAGIIVSGREAGDPAAPVTVELWMDYQAAGAATIADPLGPELRSRITSGAIRVVQRDLATLGDESVLAATAVRCVARQDGPAWFLHDALTSSGQGAGTGLYTARRLLSYLARLGLDVRALSDCLDDPQVAAEVAAETADGTAAGLTAAPTVIVRKDGTVLGQYTGELDVTRILATIDASG